MPPQIFKCCVLGCSSTNEHFRLYNIPRNDELRELWLSFLLPHSPFLSDLRKQSLINKRVCIRHFERHQVRADGKLNQYPPSYPSLFTEREIMHGTPLQEKNLDTCDDHTYCIVEKAMDSPIVEESILEEPMVQDSLDSSDHASETYHDNFDPSANEVDPVPSKNITSPVLPQHIMKVKRDDSPTQDSYEMIVISIPIPSEVSGGLGSKRKDEIFGPKILNELSEHWGRIITEGLDKENKAELSKKLLIPENFELAKAPILNADIAVTLPNSAIDTDKMLESAQNQLGLGLAGLTSYISTLLEGKMIDRVDSIKKLTEASNILLDLHYKNTVNRQKLILPYLDKKFSSFIVGSRRDDLLFGNNLVEQINGAKSEEKSGLLVKKTSPSCAAKPITQQIVRRNCRGRLHSQTRPTQIRRRSHGSQIYRRLTSKMTLDPPASK